MAWTSGIHMLRPVAFAAAHHSFVSPEPHVNTLTLFGLISASFTATCYLRRHYGRVAMLSLAASLAATGVYGLAEGAWPLGVLEIAWAVDAVRRGITLAATTKRQVRVFAPELSERRARYGQMFDSN
jgi:hypothetical protein